jgi:hypothetical protein
MLEEFNATGNTETALMHAKLQHYNTRRPRHLMKLCMIAAIMVSDDLIIDAEHVAVALGWMLDAEAAVPEMFNALRSGGDDQIIRDAWYFVYSYNTKNKNKPLPQPSFYGYMLQRASSDKIEWIVRMMLSAKLLSKTTEGFMALGNPTK